MKTWKQLSPMVRRVILYFAAMLVLVLALVIWLHEPQQTSQVVAQQDEQEEQLQPRDVILYFTLAQEAVLYPETRQVAGCASDTACIEEIVAALVEGPQGSGGLVRVLPEGTALLGVTVAEEMATLDFNLRLVNGHPGGSLAELLTVYAVVDSVAANLPHLRQVLFLVEGQPLATLKGHVDLEQPVKADFSWTRNPQEDELTVPVRGGEDG